MAGGGSWTFLQTRRNKKVRDRVMRLSVQRCGDRGELRAGLPLEAGSRMRHLRSDRRKNTAKQMLVEQSPSRDN